MTGKELSDKMGLADGLFDVSGKLVLDWNEVEEVRRILIAHDEIQSMDAAGEALRATEPSFGRRVRELADAIHAGPREVGAGKMADRLLDLADQIDQDARLQEACLESVISMAVARLGGLVEGQPTHRGNLLQRIDALVAMEAAGVAVEPRQGGEQG